MVSWRTFFSIGNRLADGWLEPCLQKSGLLGPRSPHDAANIIGINHDFAAGLLRLQGRCGAKTKRNGDGRKTKGQTTNSPHLSSYGVQLRWAGTDHSSPTSSKPPPPAATATQCVAEARSLCRRRTFGLRHLCVHCRCLDAHHRPGADDHAQGAAYKRCRLRTSTGSCLQIGSAPPAPRGRTLPSARIGCPTAAAKTPWLSGPRPLVASPHPGLPVLAAARARQAG
jgi:hypothetical protein